MELYPISPAGPALRPVVGEVQGSHWLPRVIVAARREALRCATSFVGSAKEAMIYRRHLPGVHGALRTALDAEFQAVVVVDESSVSVVRVGQVHASCGVQRGRARRHRDPRGFRGFVFHRRSFVNESELEASSACY